jgi:hypothetical protein
MAFFGPRPKPCAVASSDDPGYHHLDLLLYSSFLSFLTLSGLKYKPDPHVGILVVPYSAYNLKL